MDDVDAAERRVMGKLDALGKELIELRAENNMLKGLLVQRPEMRAIVGELKHIRELMIAKELMSAIIRATALLRRLDESQ